MNNTGNTIADILRVEKEDSVSSPTNQTQMAQLQANLSPTLTSPTINAGMNAFSSTITNQIYVQNESAEFVTTGDKRFKQSNVGRSLASTTNGTNTLSQSAVKHSQRPRNTGMKTF